MVQLNFTRLNFQQAIAFFREKQNIPTERWDDLWQEEYDIAFTVAGAMRADLLNDLRQAVDRAVSEGITRREFAQQFDEIVTRHGWAFRGERNWRLNTIYSTNLRTAYAAGRYEQMRDPNVLEARPYWQWIHSDSRFPRPLHRALHRRVFRADDLFWSTMAPPCGFGCNCYVVSLSQRDIDREGLEVENAPEVGSILQARDELSRAIAARVEPDPGWGHMMGQSRPEQRQEILQNIASRLPPELASQLQENLRDILPITDDRVLIEVIGLELQRQGKERSESNIQAILGRIQDSPTRAMIVNAVQEL